MDMTEAMDREVVVERAETVRLWLLGLNLSGRAADPLQRELGAIIDDDPGGYINGQRPLAGMSVADFIAELDRPGGGVVGRVKRINEAVLQELRTAIARAPRRPPTPAPPTHQLPQAVTPADAVPAAAPRRGPGRPKGSTKAALAAAAAAAAEANPAPAPPKRGPGRPRRTVAPPAEAPPAEAPPTSEHLPEPISPTPPPAATNSAPSTPQRDDPMLRQLLSLWPRLHPHARRALLTYASGLWTEADYEG